MFCCPPELSNSWFAGLLWMLVSGVCCGAGELEIIINSIHPSHQLLWAQGLEPYCSCLIFVLPFYRWLTRLHVSGVRRRIPGLETWVLTNGSARCGGGRWRQAGPNLGRGSYYPVDMLLDMLFTCVVQVFKYLSFLFLVTLSVYRGGRVNI